MLTFPSVQKWIKMNFEMGSRSLGMEREGTGTRTSLEKYSVEDVLHLII
jgi:hypothetical protein